MNRTRGSATRRAVLGGIGTGLASLAAGCSGILGSGGGGGSPTFRDDFTSNTLSQYDVERERIEPDMGGEIRVRYDAENDALAVAAPNNKRVILSPDVTPPQEGAIDLECTPARDFHSGLRVGAAIRFQDGAVLRGGVISPTWDSKDKLVFVRPDGDNSVRKGPATLPLGERRTVTLEWGPNGASLASGSEPLDLPVELSGRTPASVSCRVFQGTLQLHSLTVA